MYKEGILELERGINIDVWQGHGEKWVKAQRLHDKMQTNLAMAKDRLHFLGERFDVLKAPLSLAQSLASFQLDLLA